MADQILRIDANDLRHFFLRVDGDTITIGRDPETGDGTIKNMRIKGIHCELQVSDDPLAVSSSDSLGKLADHLLVANQERRLESARLCVGPSCSANGAEEQKSKGTHRLVALNGADYGRVFPLHETGYTRIGTDSRLANIVLRDNYAAHVQCKLEIAGDNAFVTHLDGSGGTFVNKNRIMGRMEIKPGDVVRVGNTQLRFESGKSCGTVAPAGDVVATRDVKPVATMTPFQQLLAQTPTTPVKASPATAAAEAPEPLRESSALEKLLHLEKRNFGHFQIEQALGRGHYGVVFRARDVNTNQTVALKVLSPEFPKSEPELLTLSRAFKPAATLRDSHLVALKSIGRTDNYTWIAREFVEGESLATLLTTQNADNKSRWRRACRIGSQIAAALDFLHQHKIPHLNLTPRNILIRREDNVAKLADVLLEQALCGSHVEQSTRGKKRMAEAIYLAPEQLAGSEADAKSDQYSLGVLCYHLVAGRPPHAGPTIDDVTAQMSWGAVSKPSRHNPDIPPPFEAAILKLLSRSPSGRFADVGEFLDIVEPMMMMHDIK